MEALFQATFRLFVSNIILKGETQVFKAFKKPAEISTSKIVDGIEAAVLNLARPYGFKKHGRTLHRFVDGDISQVIHFQSGMPAKGMQGLLCVNIGIRIPECSERTFHPINSKKYYGEHECTMRSRLGTVRGKDEAWFDLTKHTDKIEKSIISEIEGTVIPAFEVLKTREDILALRKSYNTFDVFDHTRLLDECMIYGHLGDTEKAKELFEAYYRSALDEYNDKTQNGFKYYLTKGQQIVYMGRVIRAEKDGYVTLYGANHGHIDYLDELAKKLGLNT